MRSYPDEARGQRTGIEVIQDPHAIQRLYYNLVQSAEREIILYLPTSSAFLREEKMGIIQSLQNAALRGINVKVITPTDEKIESRIQALFQNKEGGIELRRIRHKSEAKESEARAKMLIVDKKEYLVVELKDDSKETFVDAVRLAIYSATEATVKSYLTLFESLWEQAGLYQQLEAHDKMQREFINIAAHELRTPIQPLLGVIELIDMKSEVAEGDEEEEVRGITKQDVRIIARNILRLQNLSKAILDTSRIESSALNLNKEKFDLNEKIRSVIADVTVATKKHHNLQISFDKTDSPVIVEADKIRIFEVISNLLSNAVKHTNEGTIKVTLRKNHDTATVTVRDSGIGIDSEALPRLFTRFGAGNLRTSGSGLGLYISKGIIEAHGGKIWGENNRNGDGATFAFTLPIVQS